MNKNNFKANFNYPIRRIYYFVISFKQTFFLLKVASPSSASCNYNASFCGINSQSSTHFNNSYTQVIHFHFIVKFSSIALVLAHTPRHKTDTVCTRYLRLQKFIINGYFFRLGLKSQTAYYSVKFH